MTSISTGPRSVCCRLIATSSSISHVQVIVAPLLSVAELAAVATAAILRASSASRLASLPLACAFEWRRLSLPLGGGLRAQTLTGSSKPAELALGTWDAICEFHVSVQCVMLLEAEPAASMYAHVYSKVAVHGRDHCQQIVVFCKSAP